MRKMHRSMVVSFIAIAMIMLFAGMAIADVLIDTKIQDKVVAVDKNGNTYVRFIINETRKLQGVGYDVGVAVMAFSAHVEAANKLEAGDSLKAICSSREYQGRKSYTILKLLP